MITSTRSARECIRALRYILARTSSPGNVKGTTTTHGRRCSGEIPRPVPEWNSDDLQCLPSDYKLCLPLEDIAVIFNTTSV